MFLIFGVVAVPVCQSLLFFVLTSTAAIQANLFVMIVSILFSLIVGLVLEIKKRVGPYHKFFVPALISVCWCFCIIPYIVGFPLASSFMNDNSTQYEIFVKVTLAASAFFLIMLTSGLAIILNVFLQKVEEEKLIKFVIKYLKRKLRELAVKGEDIALRRFYDAYCKIGPKPLTNLMIKDRRPVLA